MGDKEHTLKSPQGELEIELAEAVVQASSRREHEGPGRGDGCNGSRWKVDVVWGTPSERHVEVCSAWSGQGL